MCEYFYNVLLTSLLGTFGFALGGTPFRKNYAGLGYTYDVGRDAFIPPKPYASWLLNENTCLWDAPVPYPTDVGTEENRKRYIWDEATTSWVLDETVTA